MNQKLREARPKVLTYPEPPWHETYQKHDHFCHFGPVFFKVRPSPHKVFPNIFLQPDVPPCNRYRYFKDR